MIEIVLSILVAKSILYAFGVIWATVCPRIYKYLWLHHDLSNDQHGNLYTRKSGKHFGRTILPAPMNPFK